MHWSASSQRPDGSATIHSRPGRLCVRHAAELVVAQKIGEMRNYFIEHRITPIADNDKLLYLEWCLTMRHMAIKAAVTVWVCIDKSGGSSIWYAGNIPVEKRQVMIADNEQMTRSDPGWCQICQQGSHSIKNCPQFQDASTEQRQKWNSEQRRCVACLHGMANCSNKAIAVLMAVKVTTLDSYA